MIEFKEFPKMARFSRDIIITEEEIKEDILDRYNISWDPSVKDTTGMIQECKDNFKRQVELLIKTIKDQYEEKAFVH